MELHEYSSYGTAYNPMPMESLIILFQFCTDIFILVPHIDAFHIILYLYYRLQ